MHSRKYESTLSPRGREKIAGVCCEVAQRIDLPVWLVRLLLVLMAFKFTWPCIIGYFIGWLCLADKK
ncbi:PspC domain-containing protein [Pseudoalteromonas luteoviolacea]|uniref:PspC domain-containing protein n=1 Tax=Pseudoalteromonas luteoviolacea TaxID=43657 RepID=UPI001F1D6224|nr:PspC domain-containing protein [Pseudoalteromonas luteoviolacea]MCF6441092.1 PspC domain-containing protein [Pseudoalteromonas luteoviolacea]